MKVDIIIPTYRPDDTFCLLLQKLQEQTFIIHRIILMNTEEALWEEAKRKYPIEQALRNLPCDYTLLHVSKEEFDHGATRMLGAAQSEADVIVFMTQDAMPANPYLVANLVEPFVMESFQADAEKEQAIDVEKTKRCQPEDAKKTNKEAATVAVAYARQLPREDCSVIECYTRQFNYPDAGRKKTKADIAELGIKTFFCSDVCAAYRRDVFEKLGGFESPVIFNEDMFFAARAIEADYAVEYRASACVVHSHNYSIKQQFRRNFDLAVSQTMHPEIFEEVSSESEGIKLVINTMKHLVRIGKPYLIWNLGWQCVGKYAGYFMGKRYKRLTRKMILKCTMSPDYWKKIWRG
ncbi:MAG: glycosyltransferase [Roseburia sp.]|nr:glycosyltransferase [Roseburia sp.]